MEQICDAKDVQTIPFYLSGVACQGGSKRADILCLHNKRGFDEWKCEKTRYGFQCKEFKTGDKVRGRCIAAAVKPVTKDRTSFNW